MDLLDIKMLNTAVEAELNRRLAPWGLTFTQATALRLLSASPSTQDALTQHELETCMGLSRPTVNTVLRGMAAKDLVTVEIDPVDRRKKRIHLTAAGAAMQEAVSGVVTQLRDQAVSGLTPDEVASIHALMARMRDNITAVR
ncbi:MAG TPA: MarR family transcriptional regulator [Pseudoclavibacter sp.]|nr:MarR family transcriptional regulator [Pseudoclavibacter sp.]